jgi:hypothetical protein
VFLFAEVATREAGQGEPDAGQPNKALHQTILHEMPQDANKEACRINGQDGLKIHELRLTILWDVVAEWPMVECRPKSLFSSAFA